MQAPRQFAWKHLGVRLPDVYLKYIHRYAEGTHRDPEGARGWVSGLGDLHYAVGTTLAFRQQFPDFPLNVVVFGFLRREPMYIPDVEKAIYAAINVKTHEVYEVDSFGNIEKVADKFRDWAEGRFGWLKDRPGGDGARRTPGVSRR